MELEIFPSQNTTLENLYPCLKSLEKLKPSNPKVYESVATTDRQLFFEIKNLALLNKSVYNLKTAIQLDPKSASAFGKLTGVYYYFTQKGSAKLYLALTDNVDPKAVNPEVRKIPIDN